MSDPTTNTLHIRNHFPIPVTVFVPASGWNCCFTPGQNTMIGYVQPFGSVDLSYCKTSGHGCDGNQGEFQLQFNATDIVNLNFDSRGAMAPPDAVGCEAAVSQDSDGTFSLIVYN